MDLNDLVKHPLGELLEETDITSMKPISDDNGKVVKIIIEYVPKVPRRVNI
jgi:hypothetical protein